VLWRVEDHVEQALWLLTEKGQARGPRRTAQAMKGGISIRIDVYVVVWTI